MQNIKTKIAIALVRIAIFAAPASMAGKLRDVIAPTGGGGPRPVEPR